MFVGEKSERNMSCTKLYIDGKEIEGINGFSAVWSHEMLDEHESINLNNNEFSCSFRVADKELSTYYHLMNNSKSWRIRKKNRKRYDERFIEMFGVILGAI